MSYDLIRSATGILLLTAIFISTGDKLVPVIGSGNKQSPARTGSTPSGVSQSDWGGILQAHEDWKHSIREEGDGWRTHNSETGLTARFDRRGVEVQPEGQQGADWSWGLEMVSHGVGKTQIYTKGVVPEVQTAGRRIGYEWNGKLEEWYQNDDHGLEHGYTIMERPASTNETDSLVVRLRIRGGLRVVGSVAGCSITFGNEKGHTLLRYSDLKVLDAVGRDLPASFESDGENGIRIRVDDTSASYPLTIDPIIQQANLKASNAEAGDYFGWSVAISGETVVVGAWDEDSSATGGQSDNSADAAGAAYVFVRSGTTWSQQAFLKASNADAEDYFGSSVAISGETVVVGASGEASTATGGESDNSASAAGAAYVFVRSGTTWSQQAYLKASNAEAYDYFGWSVAISGQTVVVGAIGESSSATGGESDNSDFSAGAAYVFVRSGTMWSQQAYLKASNAGGSDRFGYSVAISGETVVVGAIYESSSATGGQSDNTATLAGAAYVLNIPPTIPPPILPPPITIGIVEPPVTAAPIGPGSTTTVTQTLTNNTPVPITGTFVATLPNGLSAIGCTSPFGSCGVTTTTSGGALNGTNRNSSINNSQANQTVTWTGTIPANGSVTITYQVQVGVQVTSGSQYCITSMIGTTPGPTTCIRVNTPASGPGNMPIAARLPNPQKPGSLLIFNVYTSSVNTSLSDTQISLTNTNPVSPANVHLFFVDGSSCSVADQIVTLTQNQTVTFRASDVDPGVTGYLIAVAVDQSGCPVVGNYLIGVEDVRFESGHQATLPAIGVSGLGVGATPCLPNSVTTTLAFNGVQYDELPRGLGIASLPSLATGNSPMLIINRIGGDLTSGAERMGSLAGLLFDDGETSRSFTLTGGMCQMRGMLGNNLPRTVPRYGTVIPAGRTGWMKFWAAGDEALTGVMINATTSGFSGGYNLQSLTTTGTATLTIPVIPVR